MRAISNSHKCKPLVSVIIPFLNAEKFFEEAIGSVLVQTYTHWELLLVDDGSTDASTAIARCYVEQYPEKVRYLEHQAHENRGVSASRNLGVRHAQGEYIAVLDADDIWRPQKLERQVAILQSHPEVAMTYGPGQWWYSWTGNAEDSQRDFVQDLGLQPSTLCQPPTLLPLFLRQEMAVPVPSLLARRDLIGRIGGWEEAFWTLYEDQVFWAKMCLEASVFVEGECYYWYRKHPDSLCAAMKRTGQYSTARLTFLRWLEEYLSQRGVRDDEVWSALRQQLSLYHQPFMRRLSKRAKRHMTQAKETLKLLARLALPVSIYQGLKAHRDRLVSLRRAS
jgi:glycosyltransferase involved in cell wall biosynthesis